MPPAEIPLEQLALPAHIRHLLDSITEPAPEPEDASVVRKPEPEEEAQAKSGPSGETLAKADRYHPRLPEAVTPKSGAKRSGWRKDPRQRMIGRDPSWVTNRIKTQPQAESSRRWRHDPEANRDQELPNAEPAEHRSHHAARVVGEPFRLEATGDPAGPR